MVRGEWVRKMIGLAACMALAGCLGAGSGGGNANDSPVVIPDPPDTVVPVTPVVDDEEDDEEDIVDIITDIVTTSVSVTTITATGGS